MDTKTTIQRYCATKNKEKAQCGSPKNQNKFKRSERKGSQTGHLAEKNPNLYSFGRQKISARTSQQYEEIIQTLVKQNYRLKQDIVELKTKQMLLFDQKKIKKLLTENQELRSHLFFDQQKIKKLIKLKMKLKEANNQLSKRCQQFKIQLSEMGDAKMPLENLLNSDDLDQQNLLQSGRPRTPSISGHFCCDQTAKNAIKSKVNENYYINPKLQNEVEQDFIGNKLKRVKSLERFSNRFYFEKLNFQGNEEQNDIL